MLGSQHLAQLVGHEDVAAHGRESWRQRSVSSSMTVRRTSTTVLADIVQLDAVVDGGESSELHSGGVGDHIGLVVLLAKVGNHGGAQLRGPASTAVGRGEQGHAGRVGLESVESGGLDVAGILLQREAGRAKATCGRRRSSELAHGRLRLLLGLLGLLLAGRLGALEGLSIVPGRGGSVLLLVALLGGRDGGCEHGAAVADNGAVAVGGGRLADGLGVLGLLLGDGSGGVREHAVDGGGVEARGALACTRRRRGTAHHGVAVLTRAELAHSIAQLLGHGILLAEVSGREHARHGQALGHLLQDLDEEANLHLGGLLQQGVEGGGALGLAEDAEPLLDGAQLVLEVLVERGRGHFLECVLVLVDVGEPLRGGTLHLVRVARLRVLTAKVDFRGGADATVGQWGGEAAHVGRGAQVVTGAERGAVDGRAERGRALGGAVPVG